MSKAIKNVCDVKPEKVEEFNDMNYSTQYQTNPKDPEEITFDDMGNIQYNYNTELTLLTGNAAPMENNQPEENISFHLGNNPNQGTNRNIHPICFP